MLTFAALHISDKQHMLFYETKTCIVETVREKSKYDCFLVCQKKECLTFLLSKVHEKNFLFKLLNALYYLLRYVLPSVLQTQLLSNTQLHLLHNRAHQKLWHCKLTCNLRMTGMKYFTLISQLKIFQYYRLYLMNSILVEILYTFIQLNS